MSEHPALVTAARLGLPVPVRSARLTEDAAPDVLRIARIDRLGGLLAAALEAGHIDADHQTEAAIVELWHDQLLASVVVESLAVRTARLLDDAGVVWRLTKGAALAHLDYTDPAVRPFGDVDVVVHPTSWDAATTVLSKAGLTRAAPELRRGFDTRFGKGATFTSPDGLEVDLHRRFAVGRFGVRCAIEDVFAGADEITLGGRSLPTLDGPGRLLHACFHASLGGFRHLRARRDVAQLVLVSAVEWERTREMAERWGVAAVVADAVTDTWAHLQLDVAHPIVDWARKVPVTRRDARALTVFHDERPFREQALTAVGTLPLLAVPPYLFALVVPSRAAREARRGRMG